MQCCLRSNFEFILTEYTGSGIYVFDFFVDNGKHSFLSIKKKHTHTEKAFRVPLIIMSTSHILQSQILKGTIVVN